MRPRPQGKPAIDGDTGVVTSRPGTPRPPFEAVDARLREEANVLRKWGAESIADAIDRCRDAYQDAFREHEQQLVSLAEAALYSGYSKDHLRRLARSGSLRVTLRGRRHFFELGSLPRKSLVFDDLPARQYDVAADARRVIDRRLRGGLHGTQEVTDREGQ
jgi:hypothetical protein